MMPVSKRKMSKTTARVLFVLWAAVIDTTVRHRVTRVWQVRPACGSRDGQQP